jgi:hypothetical protein
MPVFGIVLFATLSKSLLSIEQKSTILGISWHTTMKAPKPRKRSTNRLVPIVSCPLEASADVALTIIAVRIAVMSFMASSFISLIIPVNETTAFWLYALQWTCHKKNVPDCQLSYCFQILFI